MSNQLHSGVVYKVVVGELTVTAIVSGKFRQNCYVVANRFGGCVVIDPGEFEAVDKYLSAESLVVNHLLLTHGHFDHLGGARELSLSASVPCVSHARERRLIRQAGLYSLRFIGRSLKPPDNLSFFDDDLAAITWEGRRIDILPTPGHTEGSVSYALPGMVFTGDTLFKEHIGPTVYPGSSRTTLLKSVRFMLASLDADVQIFAGHGDPWAVKDAQRWLSDSSIEPKIFDIFGS